MNVRTCVTLLLGVCFLFVPASRAENKEKRVKMTDLPEAVRKTVLEQSRGATIRGLSKEIENGKTYYEVELSISAHTKDVLIDAGGAVVEIEEQVTLESLPPAVKATIEKIAGKGKVLKVESVTRNGTLEMYEVRVRARGKTSEMKVGPDGTLLANSK